MNYTQHYMLPQWVPEDRILMKDFNNAMSNIDLVVANTTALALEVKDTAIGARATADTAKSKADAAFDRAVRPHFYAGTYTGTGDHLIVTFGFKPKFLLIYSPDSTLTASEYIENFKYFFAYSGKKVLYQLELSDTGFDVYVDPDRDRFPILNERGRVYEYIAFQ